MRSLLFLAAVCCLVLSAGGSPIARPEDDKISVEVGRQAAPAAPAASTDDDDDDDDDDEDDVLPDLGDDEDDDDEDEDDDDDDDDGLFSFLGDLVGADDDDDDDEEEAAAPVKPVAAPVETAPVTAAVATVEEGAAASAEVEGEAAESEATEEEPEAGQKEPASAEVESSPAEPAAADDDEDDDEEEDALDAFTPEDDDDEDDEEDDDDDDDEELGIGRNNSEKHSRSLSEPNKKQAVVPAIYIIKYNKFVDVVINKMNDILKQSYDPVSVKLQPIDASKKTTKPKKNKKTKGKKKSSNKKKNTARSEIKDSITTTEDPASAALMEENPLVNEVKIDALVEQTQTDSRAIQDKENAKAKPTANSTKTTKKPPTKTQKPKTKPTSKPTTKKPTATKNKTKAQKSKPRAKGTLYGLSSLRRIGDVAVNIMSDHTTVKSNFAVGPLILKVEKVVGRGAKKEVKSATATTAEMTGKLSLRINNEGVATLHSIKVLQPKQVRVDSNHERTRELVWKRSARIAHVVSEKLFSASKPMFHNQPVVTQ